MLPLRLSAGRSPDLELAPRRCDHRAGFNVPRIADIPGPYRFFFYSFDCAEPMRVHVRRERHQAKFWLNPVVLAWNRGFSPRELNEIRRIILESEVRTIEA